jgi:hypothetical protein
MWKSERAKAQEQFAATQKKAKQSLNEKQKARRDIAERMARQRALRLAKETADKESEALESETPVATKAKSLRLPQAHRRQS